jgi:alpha-L-rhamnosidase
MNPSKRKRESDRGPTFQVDTLRVNDSEAPTGLEREDIRFSWRLWSEVRGMRVVASRVWVATDRRQLDEGSADVWDSGKRSNLTLHADYVGPRLVGASRYWWKAAVWDAYGRRAESEPEPTFFDTGLLSEEWRASWIWRSRRKRTNDFAYFRKEILVKRSVAYAKLFVSAHNTAQVFINGQRIGGYGSPAPTNPG